MAERPAPWVTSNIPLSSCSRPWEAKSPALIPQPVQAVVGEAAGPHDFGARLEVSGVVPEDLRVFHDRSEKAFRDLIRQLQGVPRNKIALHGVHHDISAACCCLVRRQRHGELRVHDRELRAGNIVVVAALFPGRFIRDDRAVAHLAACCGDGDDRADGKASGSFSFMIVQFPHVLVRLGQTVGDGLAGIDHGTAAHSQDEVQLLLQSDGDAFPDFGDPGIRHYAAKLRVEDAFLVKGSADLGQQAGSHCAAAAVMDQDPGAAAFLHELPGLQFRFTAKNDLRWCIICKVIHAESPSNLAAASRRCKYCSAEKA